jgi:hypothetical protein
MNDEPLAEKRGTYRSAINEYVLTEIVYHGPTSAIGLWNHGAPHSHGALSKALRRLRARDLLTVEEVVTETIPRVVRRKKYTLTATGRELANSWGITNED